MNTDTVTESPEIVPDRQGGAVIVWTETHSSFGNIYAQRVDSSGNKMWNDRGAPVCTLYTASYPYSKIVEIVCTEDNNFAITWTDYRNGNQDIYLQKIDSSGAPIWTPNGIAICDTLGAQAISFLCGIESNTIITWSDKRGSDWDVYIQKVDSMGEGWWGSNGMPICTEIGDQAGYGTGDKIALVTSLQNVIVSWRDKRAGNLDIYTQAMDLNGTPLWQNNGVFVCSAAPSTEENISFSIKSDGRGGVIIPWSDYRAGNWDIYAQRVDSSGVLQWGDSALAVCTTSEDQCWGPVVTTNGKGGAIVTWGNSKGPGANVYVQRVGDEVISIDENSKLQIPNPKLEVYPNPFIRSTIVRLEDYRLEDCKVRIYDVMGRLVEEKSKIKNQNAKLVIGKELPAGVYFVKAQRHKLTKIIKIGGVK
jgi:hypothetical protein